MEIIFISFQRLWTIGASGFWRNVLFTRGRISPLGCASVEMTKCLHTHFLITDSSGLFSQGLLEKDISFPCPSNAMGKGKKYARCAIFVSSERRVYKGHDIKLCDWQGLCCPEPLRFDWDSMNVRKAAD